MKLQLQGQHLRLRIDEAELTALRDGATLENATRLGAGAGWRHSLRQIDAPAPELRAQPDGFDLAIPASMLHAYAGRLPCREGLVLSLQAGADALELVLEVDVRDSVRTRGAVRRRE